MTKEQLENWLLERGYTKDRFGHFKMIRTDGKETRYKMNKYSVRYELKAQTGGWVKCYGGFYKNLSIDEGGKLKGMQRAV